MLPTSMNEFIIAIVGASASFVGLLFVAISFVMNETTESEAELTSKRVLAESSYAALLNVFFIGLVGLIPGTNIGYVMLVMSWAGLVNVFYFLRSSKSHILQNIAILGFSRAVYTLEGIYSIVIIVQGNHHYVNRYLFLTIIVFLFATALSRAWELTGIRRDGRIHTDTKR